MSSNIKFEYLYRDAGNYKNWGEVIFSNGSSLSTDEVLQRLRNVLIDQTFFPASTAMVPDLHFQSYDPEIDHGWHEFHGVSPTEEEPNDLGNRSIETFLEGLARVSELGTRLA